VNLQVLSALSKDLGNLGASSRLRTLIRRSGVDFASNDYLGLARSDVLVVAARDALERGVALGSGGSRLLRGNDPEHEALEGEAAALFGVEAALSFPTGYTANAALLSTLPQRGDLILHDNLIHASSHEGMRLSRAIHQGFRHNDVDHCAHLLSEWRSSGGMGTAWLLVESLYSMDGDVAPLADFQALANGQGAMLVVDEAHATGVIGPQGKGLAATLPHRDNVITLHTFGKALGCEGAVLCGPAIMRDFLINRGRSFIFSTAPSPLRAAVARAALAHVADADDLQARLQQRVSQAESLLSQIGIAPSGSQIIPVVIGDDRAAMEAARTIQAAGYDVRGIRPPTVPEGTARLRISITLNASEADIAGLAACLASMWQR